DDQHWALTHGFTSAGGEMLVGTVSGNVAGGVKINAGLANNCCRLNEPQRRKVRGEDAEKRLEPRMARMVRIGRREMRRIDRTICSSSARSVPSVVNFLFLPPRPPRFEIDKP